MKSLIIIFGALLLIISLPFVFNAIDDGLTDTYTQTFSGVSTGAAVYSANVTLGRAIYGDDSTSVTEITSNVTADSPSAATFNSVSRALQVNGLEQSKTRTLTVEFLINSTTLPTGIGTIFTLIRWFWIFAIMGMIAGSIYAFFD